MLVLTCFNELLITFRVLDKLSVLKKMAAPNNVDIPGDYLSKSFKLEEEAAEGIPLQTLNSFWTLWFDKTKPAMGASEYESNLQKVYTFNTIQGFWAVYNNVPGVEEIKTRYSYHLMRDERRPVWEEPYNQGGGAWRLRCRKADTPKVWRELLLAVIDEQLSDSLAEGDDIVGLTVSIRDHADVLQIWNQYASLADKSTIISKVYRILADVDFQEPLYNPHQTHHAYTSRR